MTADEKNSRQVNIDFWLGIGDEFKRVLCPTCGEPYCHIRRAYTLFGNDDSEAVIYDGTSMRGVAPRKERRSAIAVDFDCENSMCELFRLVIQQHKGINEIHVESIVWNPQCAKLEDRMNEYLSWRSQSGTEAGR